MKARAPSHVAISGAGGQLGRALARHLAACGARVSLSDADAGVLDIALNAIGRNVSGHIVNVREHQAVSVWLRDCHAQQPLDWVVANAAIGGPAPCDQAFEPPARSAELVAVNILGTLGQCIAAIPLLSERGGRLILVSPLAAMLGNPSAPVYAASKAAVRAFGQSLGARLHGTPVGVTVALPGFLHEGMDTSAAWRPFATTPEAAARRIVGAAQLGRAEVAFPAAMVWLIRGLALLPPSLRIAVYRAMSGVRGPPSTDNRVTVRE